MYEGHTLTVITMDHVYPTSTAPLVRQRNKAPTGTAFLTMVSPLERGWFLL